MADHAMAGHAMVGADGTGHSTIGQIRHLTTRFVGSLHPGPPAPDDEAWALGWLGPGERELWGRMSNPDRRHAVGVAREVVRRWPEFVAPDGAEGRADGSASAGAEDEDGVEDGAAGGPTRDVVAAGLLHDVGKVDAGLGTLARVVATVVWAVLDDETAARWAERGDPVRSRLGRYRRHPEIGAELLRQAGADPLTSAWAGEHHRSSDRWTVPTPVGLLLKACDDD